ncbi:MAG: IS5 family transposase [Bacteroidota bacterium]
MPEMKDTYKPKDWKAYNESLCRRGSLVLWLEEGVYRHWRDMPRLGKVVGEKQYSDVVIEFCLTIKQVYGLALRQCTGFTKSVLALMGLSELVVPDYSTLCRRSSGLKIKVSQRPIGEKLHVAVDSTGLKVFGEGEWKVRKHGVSKRRTWRKLHLGIDVNSQEIVSCGLTENSVDDAAMTEPLLSQVVGNKVEAFYGDGAYDKKKARQAVARAGAKAIVPPPSNAVKRELPGLEERNQAIDRIGQIGRQAWKKEVGYHKRSLSETAMYRYKMVIGNTLTAHKMENQVTEVKVGCHILNVFRGCGMSNAVKT